MALRAGIALLFVGVPCPALLGLVCAVIALVPGRRASRWIRSWR